MNVFVACSSMNNIEEKYFEYAKELCNLLKIYDDEVFIGGKIGIMGFIVNNLRGFKKEPNIIITDLYKNELSDEDIKKTIVEDTDDRLEYILDNCTCSIVFPGGLGTLSELFQFMEAKRSDKRNMEIILLNIDGFYDGVLATLKELKELGFLNRDIEQLLHVATNISDLDNMYKNIKEKGEM